MRVIDLITNDGGSTQSTEILCDGIPMRRENVKIMSPSESRMDKAIWTAFQYNDFSSVYEAIDIGASVNYQRELSDGTTALMAAICHGNELEVKKLRSRGAKVDV